MSRVIIFSEFFPKYHPKAGQPTFFVEKILLSINYLHLLDLRSLLLEYPEVYRKYMDRALCSDDIIPKYHTIRRGNRWKVGDWFSPRIWSGVPYRSKQIQFAPDIQVKKVWTFSPYCPNTYKAGDRHYLLNDWMRREKYQYKTIQQVANNDGLEINDFMNWIDIKPFNGQIICWNDKIEY